MINFFKIYQIANVDGITMKIFLRRLAISRYYKSIPIEIGETQIKEARMEMLERVDENLS
jgi:hypothetical protein